MNFLELKQPIFIASDHGGIGVKKEIINHYKQLEFKDLGCSDTSSVDYPDYAHKLCQQISSQALNKEVNPTVMGILICGSGQGMAMTANKYKNLRAALCWNKTSSELARSHNNAQILCLGARLLQTTTVFEIIDAFFTTLFEAGRHLKRIEKI